MVKFIVIRLHANESVTGIEFTNYLTGLSISAHELSLGDPDGNSPAFGTANYLTTSASKIKQHQTNPTTKFAVATAVITIPTAVAGEYGTSDLRLDITRNGTPIIQNQLYYNVPVVTGAIPPLNNFAAIQTVSLYLTLPAPGQQLSTSAAEPVDVALPKFEDLKASVEQVLMAEQGNTLGIENLTLAQCIHIAFEITWDPNTCLMPVPPLPLEQLYTDSANQSARGDFEGKLLTFYTTLNNKAKALANYVFAVSAAIWCEEKSKTAAQVGFSFPIFPAAPVNEATVILNGTAGTLGFGVPAAYFYGLTLRLPSSVAPDRRFMTAVSGKETQTVAHIEQSINEHVLTELAVNRFQAARRLHALGSLGGDGTSVFDLTQPLSRDPTSVQGLVSSWLLFAGADLSPFWNSVSTVNPTGHLVLLVTAITDMHAPLIAAIRNAAFGATDVNSLADKTTGNWQDLLNPDPSLLPDFTKPGTTEERIDAFIRHLGKFFDVPKVFEASPAPVVETAPGFDRPAGNPLDTLLTNYPSFSFNNWDATLLANALTGIFPGDPAKQQQFTQWLTCIQGVTQLADGIEPAEIQFSVIEALWARGFTNAQSIKELSLQDFKNALAGSVAYDHAEAIWQNAGGSEPGALTESLGFKPVNPDGAIVNCVPPAHLSPLGPVAYLHDLLCVADVSTCDNPLPIDAKNTLAMHLAGRRGPLGNLLATKSNLEVPLPLIDIVNESLEYMVADSASSGAIYNTAGNQVGGHELSSNPNPTADAYHHDPVTMFESLPEHSTPIVPTAKQSAYDTLKSDFSSCKLPYSQPMDVARTYLKQLGSSRFATMRRFRKDITGAT